MLFGNDAKLLFWEALAAFMSLGSQVSPRSAKVSALPAFAEEISLLIGAVSLVNSFSGAKPLLAFTAFEGGAF